MGWGDYIMAVVMFRRIKKVQNYRSLLITHYKTFYYENVFKSNPYNTAE